MLARVGQMINVMPIDQPISATVVVCQKFDMFNKVADFFNWAPENMAQAPNFLFQEPEGLPYNFLRQQACQQYCLLY